MKTVTKLPATAALEALKALEQAWAYYEPEPLTVTYKDQPDLFEYHTAA